MVSPSELQAMRRAIALACTPGVRTRPNPRVGAVVQDDEGQIVGEGFHRGPGSPHAEVAALTVAGDLARGATVLVTLEPCNHTARTGPCAQALIDAGVRRVVFAQHDENPVADGGAETLRSAGIDVEGGVLRDEAELVNEQWTFAMRHRRPWVTWKFATTLDGRSAASDGTARWITGAQARRDVHRLRAQCDAVLVGTGTVLADDPALTVRDEGDEPVPATEQPLRAVMGLRPVPADAQVLDGTAETLLLATRDPSDALKTLFERDRQFVFLEGGPTLAAAFLAAGLVDEVVAYVAPALLGAGPAAVADLGVTTIADVRRFDLVEATRVGDDVRLTLRPQGASADPVAHSLSSVLSVGSAGPEAGVR